MKKCKCGKFYFVKEQSPSSPCKKDTAEWAVGGDSETQDMKKLFEVCYSKGVHGGITMADLKDYCAQEDLFVDYEMLQRSDQVRFGSMIKRYTGRILSDIKMQVDNAEARGNRQKFTFKKLEDQKPKKDGNLGNVGNLPNLVQCFQNNSNKIQIGCKDSQDSQDSQDDQDDLDLEENNEENHEKV